MLYRPRNRPPGPHAVGHQLPRSKRSSSTSTSSTGLRPSRRLGVRPRSSSPSIRLQTSTSQAASIRWTSSSISRCPRIGTCRAHPQPHRSLFPGRIARAHPPIGRAASSMHPVWVPRSSVVLESSPTSSGLHPSSGSNSLLESPRRSSTFVASGAFNRLALSRGDSDLFSGRGQRHGSRALAAPTAAWSGSDTLHTSAWVQVRQEKMLS